MLQARRKDHPCAFRALRHARHHANSLHQSSFSGLLTVCWRIIIVAMKHCAKNHEQGVALIMVIFMVVLCSAILVSLSDSTYTAMRINRTTEQRVKAEYIMKSAVNFARVLIQNDATEFDDPSRDDWMQFQEGREVPGELVGISEPNVRISLMIAPENSKIPLVEVVQSTGVDKAWRDVLVSLFHLFGVATWRFGALSPSLQGTPPRSKIDRHRRPTDRFDRFPALAAQLQHLQCPYAETHFVTNGT